MKLFRKIHLWLSVPFGLIITLICFSGAMLVFEPEITRILRNDVYHVSSSQGNPMPMEELMETVEEMLPDSVSITGVTVFNDKDRTYQINLSKPRRASIFIDQYSGRITGKYERIAFFSTMFRLHRWLLDSTNPHGGGVKVGKILVGISTLVFVVTLITGIVIWWPRVCKNLRHGLSISVKNGWCGFWKSLHVAGGVYVMLLLMAMSLTGLTWSFEWYRKVFYAVCGVEYSPQNRASAEKNQKTSKHSDFYYWQQIYDNLKVQNPTATRITIGLETASVSLGDKGNGIASDRYKFSSYSGEITAMTKYADFAPADRLRGWIYSVHTGTFGGIGTRILWFLGAIFGASLPLTGYYIWICHIHRRKTRH